MVHCTEGMGTACLFTVLYSSGDHSRIYITATIPKLTLIRLKKFWMQIDFIKSFSKAKC